MGKKKAAATTIVNSAIKLVGDTNVQKSIMGVYSDGTPRSFIDCLQGEILSPKSKEKLRKKGGKKNKKAKKSKKKKTILDYDI